MKDYKRLFGLLKPYKTPLLVGAVFLIAASATNLAVPLFVKRLVDIVMVQKNLQLLNLIAGQIAFLFLLQLILTTVQNYIFDITEKRVITDFRKQVFQHLHTLSVGFFIKRRTGEILSRMTNDITTIENIVTDLPATSLKQSVRLIGGIVIVIYMNWKLTFMILVLSPILVLFARTFGRKLKRLSTEIQDKLATSTTILEENISCIRIVKSFVREKLEYGRFSDAVEDSFQSARRRVIIASFFGPMIGFIAFITSLILLWYGGREVITGGISPGEMIAFILYATIIAGPMGSFARMFTRLQEGMGASQRIFEILDEGPEVLEDPSPVEIPPLSGNVVFENIRFHYQEELEVLKGIDFQVEPGQTIALVGPSGAGKTTLIHLLQRFYDPTEGSITIDGIPLKKMRLADYWQQIGIVPQETILFGGSIEENIRYAKAGAGEDEIIQAAHVANAHGFISEFPHAYRTVVGEKGIRLSAGQRQRIAIARAILKHPRILILDEATSALDNESEALIQEALDRLMENRTTFIIAHRLSTVHHAHRILVLDKGRIVESGNHAELMRRQGLYHRLYTLKKLEISQETEVLET